MRSIVMKFTVVDVANQNTYGVHLKREPSGEWRIAMPDGTEPQLDYFVQLVGDNVPEVLHYLENMELDAAATNTAFNVSYVTSVITPFLRNDGENGFGYNTTLDSVLL